MLIFIYLYIGLVLCQSFFVFDDTYFLQYFVFGHLINHGLYSRVVVRFFFGLYIIMSFIFFLYNIWP